MTQTSENQETQESPKENPILNPESRAAQELRFQIQAPEAAPSPPEDDSGTAAGAEDGERKAPPKRPGRHRRVSTAIPDKAAGDRPSPPKTKPPDFSEWHGFMSDFALKWICRGYVGYAFRGIEREKILSAKELEALEPGAEMLSVASKPLAHMADRSKTLTKHGRFIIDSADGLESLIALGFWANTVRRIARSHEKERTVIIKPRKEPPSDGKPGRPNVAEVPQQSEANGRINGAGFGVPGNVPGVGG